MSAAPLSSLVLTQPIPFFRPLSLPPPASVYSCLFSAPYSKPVVTPEPESNLRPGDEVALTCVAYGGYPEAGVIWQDGSGRNLTDNITNSVVANEEGLFTMTSVLKVLLEPNNNYSCRLINPLLGDEGYAFVTISSKCLSPLLSLRVHQSTLTSL